MKLADALSLALGLWSLGATIVAYPDWKMVALNAAGIALAGWLYTVPNNERGNRRLW